MEGAIIQGLVDKFRRRVKLACPLKSYTSFGIGGEASALVTVDSQEELRWLLTFIDEHQIQWRVIGKGTNLLVSDQGFDGVIIMLGKTFTEIVVSDNSGMVSVGAAASLTKIIKWCHCRSLSCIEFLFGVPGSVGGAAVMNAGAHGGEIAEALVGIELVDKNGIHILEGDALQLSYRSFDSWKAFKHSAVITGVTLQATPGDADEISRRCKEIMRKRREAQPLGQPNAGSFFKNPPGHSAGKLIDDAGLKGFAVGGAKVSERHANFLVNTGGATCNDVLTLMKLVQQKVEQLSGVSLTPEVQVI